MDRGSFVHEAEVHASNVKGSPVISDPSRKTFGGLLQYRSCWLPSLRGWLMLMACCAILVAAGLLGLYPFLAVTRPVKAEVLVVEGWVADYALHYATAEFQTNHYIAVYSTGGPVSKGHFLADYGTFAEIGAATLLRLGLGSNVVVAVPAPATPRDRTYQSALALRQHFADAGQEVQALNLVTIGAHARRSRLLFQRGFGGDVQIGVISVPNADYDARCWWKSSAGLRDVIGETLAYLHACSSWR